MENDEITSRLSWEKFLSDAKLLINISENINDSWKLEGDCTTPGSAYLRKLIIVPNKYDKLSPLRWEYHICYSISYSVPTLYFNVWDGTGTKLSLTEVWKHCESFEKSYTSDEMYSILTQQEHPLLMNIFFMIHPCKTHEILFPIAKDCNAVIKFISSVGSMVNLTMDLAYGAK